MIIIGNIISFIGAMFMVASCITKQRRLIFLCQFVNCVLLAVASIFFGAYAGLTTLVISAVRNLAVAKNKYNKNLMILFSVLTVLFGVLANTRGFMGLVPVIATVQYTVCCYYITGEKATKFSILANVVMWVIYSFTIFDFSTAICDCVVIVVDIIAIAQLYRGERRAALEAAVLAAEEPAPVLAAPADAEHEDF